MLLLAAYARRTTGATVYFSYPSINAVCGAAHCLLGTSFPNARRKLLLLLIIIATAHLDLHIRRKRRQQRQQRVTGHLAGRSNTCTALIGRPILREGLETIEVKSGHCSYTLLDAS